jgi:hypothetical protein
MRWVRILGTIEFSQFGEIQGMAIMYSVEKVD